MRKGTVRDMKKKVLQRGLFGIPTGIAIGYVITVMMSAFWGDGSYYPCVPAFVDAMGVRYGQLWCRRCCVVWSAWCMRRDRSCGKWIDGVLPVRRRRIF